MATDLQPIVEAYLADPSPRGRDEVVRAAVPLVHSFISRINPPNSPLAGRDDLENVGLLGLLQALDAYDPAQGTAFVSYCYARVRGALVDYLRKIDVLSQRRRRQIAEVQQGIDTLAQAMHAEPQDQDVADYLGLPLEEYHAILSDAQCRFALSLHDSGSDEDFDLIDTLPHEAAQDGFDEVERRMLVAQVSRALEALPERERTIIALYFYEDLTLREIGEILDLTPARISQIIGKATLKVRALLDSRPGRMAA